VVWAGLDWQVNDPSIPSATREYNDGLARWLTPDPLGKKAASLSNPQSWNMYAYVLNNPTTNNDPNGELCVLGLTIFGSHFGGTCADYLPPRTVPPPDPPEGAVGTPTYNLITAQDQARANPAFQPKPRTGESHCNQATCSIASQTGSPTGPLQNSHGVPLIANQQIQNLVQSGQYRQVSPAEAQALANQGVPVFAGQPHAGHGHIATVRPNNTYFAPYENADPQGSGPMINNIGRDVGIVPQSGAFYQNSPVIYIAPNNPNQ
jgi:RHS repeat-associated protein